MAAAETPDPQSLKSWQGGVQYPVPTVRRVEQELRRDIASNKEKLRALVGTRYRDLLGTAETIVEMSGEIEQVDAHLTDIGRRCNPRLMQKKAAHLGQVKRDASGIDTESRAFAAQMALQHRCTSAISRLLRKNAAPLLIVKILVIARSLDKTLSQNKTKPPFLENLRSQLISLRKTVLKRIDRRLTSVKSTVDDIIEALAALCLATSSSSEDAIRHFHRVRLNAIAAQLELCDPSGANILKALKQYIRTLQTTKTLFSRRLSDALGRLKSRPILTDGEIRKLDDLDLEIFERWVAPDVKNFTPWIKVTDFQKADAEKSIKQWSKEAFEGFMKGAQRCLKDFHNFPELILLRKHAFDIWLSARGSTPTHSSLSILEGIRNLFNGRLTDILRAQAKNVDSIGKRASSVIKDWDNKEHDPAQSLWDPALTSLDYSGGARTFKQAVMDVLLGRDSAISSIEESYHAWRSSVETTRNLVEDLKRTRWGDIFDEAEDEDTTVDPAALLNEDDPAVLQEEQKSAVSQAFIDLQSSFREIVGNFGTSRQSEKAAFVLRLIRDIRRDAPNEFLAGDFIFAQEIVPELQETLATAVASQVDPLTIKLRLTGQGQKIPGRTLWEGETELPVQPSPAVFKYLRRLHAAMEQHGPDLWNPSSTVVLKKTLVKHTSESLRSTYEFLNTANASTANSSTSSDNSNSEESETDKDNSNSSDSNQKPLSPELLHDWKIQLIFDSIYLQKAFAVKDVPGIKDELSTLTETIQEDADPKKEFSKGLTKAAQEYWKRTELLFGLLGTP
ncbi:conserved hypothetical protein [Paecilomyces variotii No. 5]|uniref:Conserved oligomeric Golgi complex subunit 1 n=1 Tax=Byssochlamys spectabilis (strain No. 5 / NBRC 109023) TaxID=1356009 RepID=V5FII8_BYSSN|nr:conserved hypothetical protein [Paecilomyces variotii No. 5]